jgi:large subunit ribosomal protein L4
MEAELKDINNNIVGKVELNEKVFGLEVRKDILHTAVVNYLANQRQGTHATKTKGMVSGGGRKPWKQKHTGRARAGSIRSPLWKGGGTIFGPQPRDYSYKLNKKFRRLALRTALSAKLADKEILFVDSVTMEKPRTRDVVNILRNLGLDKSKVLILMAEKDDNVVLSARNIVGIDVVRAGDINTYVMLVHDKILITKDALGIVNRLDETEQ